MQQALEAAGAAGSIRGYVDTLNAYFERGRQEEEAILRAIDVIDRQNAALSDEDRIRRQLIQQYGESSTLIDVLLKKAGTLRANKANNDESQREIDLEKKKRGHRWRARHWQSGSAGRRGNWRQEWRRVVKPWRGRASQHHYQPERRHAGNHPRTDPLIERELVRLGALRR